MNKYPITVFAAETYSKNKEKVPMSPFQDKTFVFETHYGSTNIDLFSVFVSHWVLNIPLENLAKPIRTYRRKDNLEQFYNKNISYFVLDIDDVKTQKDQDDILNFFKDFKVIIGESKSANGIDNFNMKGLLFIDTTLDYAKRCISSINRTFDNCTIDEAVSRRVTYNAPIGKHKVLLNNETGKVFGCTIQREDKNFLDSSIPKLIKKSNQFSTETAKDITELVDNINNPDVINDLDAQNIETYCLNIFKSMKFIPVKNSDESIYFKHPSELKTTGGFFWFRSSPYTMHHHNSTRTVSIYDLVKNSDIGKKLLHLEIDYTDSLLQFNTDTKVINVNERFLETTNKEEVLSNWIEQKHGLLSIKSPMGTGKSKIINYLVQEAFSNDMSVLILTNRISVANDFGKKYNIKIYNKDRYNQGDSIIVQYDSLWKYNIQHFDMVIMDEFISLMMHSRDNLSNSSINLAKFFGCFNKKLVIADAFLTGYENFLLNNYKDNILQIDNNWRDPSRLHLYENKNSFIHDLIETAIEGSRITVSSTSMGFINALTYLLQKFKIKTITLTASTPESTKELIYKLFEEETHDKWQVLIFSPTLTVGVSNLNETYQHFHYDTSMSTNVISSIQMIKRTRKAETIKMFISQKIQKLKTTYEDLRDEYIQNIGKLEDNYMFSIDDYGDLRLSNLGKTSLKIDVFSNILEYNHKDAMLFLLKYHFLEEPKIIRTTKSENRLSGVTKKLNLQKELTNKSYIEQFLSLTDTEIEQALENENTDETLRILAQIDEHIKPFTNNRVKTKIFNFCIKDKAFIEKALYYRTIYNYSKELISKDQIQEQIAISAVNKDSSAIDFYNAVLSLDFSTIPFLKKYDLSKLKQNKTLKYVLSKSGYKIKQIGAGRTAFVENIDIVNNFGYIKE